MSETSEMTGEGVAPVDQESPELTRILKKVTWRLIPFLFVLYIMSYLDRINVSLAVLQMGPALKFDDMVFGLGTGIFFLGYCVFGVPSNLILEKVGARRWIATIMVIWGCVSVAMYSVRTAEQFYWLRFFLGVAEAGFFPGVILYLTYWFPKKQHGKAVSGFMSAIPAAAVLGGLVASKALGMEVAGLAGWQWLFIITGLPSVLLGVLVWFVLADHPLKAGWLTPDERQLLGNVIAVDKQAIEKAAVVKSETGEPRPDALDALTNWLVWSFALCYFCLTLAMYGFQLWLPQIIKSLGNLSDTTTALVSAIPAASQALGILVVGTSSDRTGDRRYHMAGAALLGALGFAGTALLSANPAAALACLCLTAFGIWGTVGPFWARTTATVSGAAAAASIALINSIGNLGGFAGPTIVAFVKTKTQSFAGALLFLSASLLIAGTLFLLLTRTRQQETAAK